MKIVLFTATGAENLGDELITLCEIRYFEKTDTHITVFSHDVARTKRFLLSQNISLEHILIEEYFPNGLRKHPLKNLKLLCKTIKIIRDTDHVYVGGGGLLYSKNEEGHSPLRLWWMRAVITKFFKKPLTYLSLGVSATREEIQPFAKGIFENATMTVRDKKSQELVKALGFTATLLPDPVLNYSAQKTEKSKIIGIAMRKGFLSDEVTKELIKKLLSQGYDILLLPHSLHPTDEVSHDGYYLQNFLFPGVSTTQSIEQTLEAYKKCHIVLSMRLHSMILALTHHVPFVAISYSQKTNTLLEEIGWNYAHQSDAKVDDILGSINTIEQEYEELCQKLAERHARYQTQYTQSFPGK